MGCLYGPANWAKLPHFWKRQRLQFTINTVHWITTQIDAPGAALPLGKKSVHSNFPAGTIRTTPQGNILGSASSSLCILSCPSSPLRMSPVRPALPQLTSGHSRCFLNDFVVFSFHPKLPTEHLSTFSTLRHIWGPLEPENPVSWAELSLFHLS